MILVLYYCTDCRTKSQPATLIQTPSRLPNYTTEISLSQHFQIDCGLRVASQTLLPLPPHQSFLDDITLVYHNNAKGNFGCREPAICYHRDSALF